jgi:hypothetical protein
MNAYWRAHFDRVTREMVKRLQVKDSMRLSSAGSPSGDTTRKRGGGKLGATPIPLIH